MYAYVRPFQMAMPVVMQGQKWTTISDLAVQNADACMLFKVRGACACPFQMTMPVVIQGQKWTTITELVEGGSRNAIKEIEPGLVAINTEPSFGIGQRAILVKTPEGNLS